ncbi:hypothetical protein ScPMuIL_012638 [Solemya velum]
MYIICNKHAFVYNLSNNGYFYNSNHVDVTNNLICNKHAFVYNLSNNWYFYNSDNVDITHNHICNKHALVYNLSNNWYFYNSNYVDVTHTDICNKHAFVYNLSNNWYFYNSNHVDVSHNHICNKHAFVYNLSSNWYFYNSDNVDVTHNHICNKHALVYNLSNNWYFYNSNHVDVTHNDICNKHAFVYNLSNNGYFYNSAHVDVTHNQQCICHSAIFKRRYFFYKFCFYYSICNKHALVYNLSNNGYFYNSAHVDVNHNHICNKHAFVHNLSNNWYFYNSNYFDVTHNDICNKHALVYNLSNNWYFYNSNYFDVTHNDICNKHALVYNLSNNGYFYNSAHVDVTHNHYYSICNKHALVYNLSNNCYFYNSDNVDITHNHICNKHALVYNLSNNWYFYNSNYVDVTHNDICNKHAFVYNLSNNGYFYNSAHVDVTHNHICNKHALVYNLSNNGYFYNSAHVDVTHNHICNKHAFVYNLSSNWYFYKSDNVDITHNHICNKHALVYNLSNNWYFYNSNYVDVTHNDICNKHAFVYNLSNNGYFYNSAHVDVTHNHICNKHAFVYNLSNNGYYYNSAHVDVIHNQYVYVLHLQFLISPFICVSSIQVIGSQIPSALRELNHLSNAIFLCLDSVFVTLQSLNGEKKFTKFCFYYSICNKHAFVYNLSNNGYFYNSAHVDVTNNLYVYVLHLQFLISPFICVSSIQVIGSQIPSTLRELNHLSNAIFLCLDSVFVTLQSLNEDNFFINSVFIIASATSTPSSTTSPITGTSTTAPTSTSPTTSSATSTPLSTTSPITGTSTTATTSTSPTTTSATSTPSSTTSPITGTSTTAPTSTSPTTTSATSTPSSTTSPITGTSTTAPTSTSPTTTSATSTPSSTTSPITGTSTTAPTSTSPTTSSATSTPSSTTSPITGTSTTAPTSTSPTTSSATSTPSSTTSPITGTSTTATTSTSPTTTSATSTPSSTTSPITGTSTTATTSTSPTTTSATSTPSSTTSPITATSTTAPTSTSPTTTSATSTPSSTTSPITGTSTIAPTSTSPTTTSATSTPSSTTSPITGTSTTAPTSTSPTTTSATSTPSSTTSPITGTSTTAPTSTSPTTTSATSTPSSTTSPITGTTTTAPTSTSPTTTSATSTPSSTTSPITGTTTTAPTSTSPTTTSATSTPSSTTSPITVTSTTATTSTSPTTTSATSTPSSTTSPITGTSTTATTSTSPTTTSATSTPLSTTSPVTGTSTTATTSTSPTTTSATSTPLSTTSPITGTSTIATTSTSPTTRIICNKHAFVHNLSINWYSTTGTTSTPPTTTSATSTPSSTISPLTGTSTTGTTSTPPTTTSATSTPLSTTSPITGTSTTATTSTSPTTTSATSTPLSTTSPITGTSTTATTSTSPTTTSATITPSSTTSPLTGTSTTGTTSTPPTTASTTKTLPFTTSPITGTSTTATTSTSPTTSMHMSSATSTPLSTTFPITGTSTTATTSTSPTTASTTKTLPFTTSPITGTSTTATTSTSPTTTSATSTPSSTTSPITGTSTTATTSTSPTTTSATITPSSTTSPITGTSTTAPTSTSPTTTSATSTPLSTTSPITGTTTTATTSTSPTTSMYIKKLLNSVFIVASATSTSSSTTSPITRTSTTTSTIKTPSSKTSPITGASTTATTLTSPTTTSATSTPSPTTSPIASTSTTVTTSTSPTSTSTTSTSLSTTSPITGTSTTATTSTSPTTITTTPLPADCPDFYPYGRSGIWQNEWLKATTSPKISIPSAVKFPFFGTSHTKLYVSKNGLISFTDKFVGSSPQPFGTGESEYLIAPFWAEIDAIQSSRQPPIVWYQGYFNQGVNNARVQQIMARATSDIRRSKDPSFVPEWVFVATWDGVFPYPESNYPQETVTFQTVLITNGVDSYVLYFYKNFNWIPLSGRNIIIGYTSASNPAYNNIYSNTAAAYSMDTNAGNYKNCVGVWIFQTTVPVAFKRVLSPTRDCTAWYKEEKKHKDEYLLANSQMVDCPCASYLIAWDSNWDFDIETGCATIRANLRIGDYGKKCCYDTVQGYFLGQVPSAGTFLRFHPTVFEREYLENDVEPYTSCCVDTNLCDLYYEVRPLSECYNGYPSNLAWIIGDPHFTTLDGFQYTFNGLGEYTLLDMQNGVGRFKLQTRTAKALAVDGREVDATVYSAIAGLHVNTDGRFQVEMNYTRTGMAIYGNGRDFTRDFYDNTSFNFVQDNLSLFRAENTVIAVFNDGIIVAASLAVRMLQVSVIVPTEYRGYAEFKGLLGNYDNNPDNDLVTADGKTLDSSITEEELFYQFGQTWQVSPSESIFIYTPERDAAYYAQPDFTPIFLSSFKEVEIVGAEAICGNTDKDCVYDYLLTNDILVANNTKNLNEKALDDKELLGNIIPALSITGDVENNEIHATINDTLSFNVNIINGSPGSEVVILNKPSGDFTYQSTTATTGVITWTLTTLEPFNFSLTARDGLYGLNGSELVLTVVLCGGCSNNGVCNFTNVPEDTYVLSTFKVATCDCDVGYAGDNCEDDFDGCAARPCSLLRNCTDISAEEEQANTTWQFICEPCPDGFTATENECADVDECRDIPRKCAQQCQNTMGSFVCSCFEGYRMVNGKCEDLDECVFKTHNCTQICTDKKNGNGYNCDCYPGYIYDADTKSCNIISANDTECQSLSCSNGCSNNGTEAKCFCDNGYELENGTSCRDIDECQTDNVCPQHCTNTDGSYSCSCYTGYRITDDNLFCIACDQLSWGDNCENVCNCAVNGKECDPVKGCICRDGWSGEDCLQDVNECVETPDICGSETICTNTNGSYICSCKTGYTEKNGTCVDLDECQSALLNNCSQICINAIGSHSCECKSGYNLVNGTDCTDINECKLGIATCEQECVNVRGSYNCYCYSNYILQNDRKTCKLVQDCTLDCSHICRVDTSGGEACYCPSGYRLGGDGITCLDNDECEDDTTNNCSHTCINTLSGYECSCNIGYKLANDRRTCEECDYIHYGENCTEVCDCGEGALRCDKVAGCICADGWTGSKCQFDTDECAASSNVCGGNEVCTNTKGSYHCACEDGYYNINNTSCIDIDECNDHNSKDTCEQICTNTAGSYHCSCHSGFSIDGTSCRDIDECKVGTSECQQVCANEPGSYKCSCFEGYNLRSDRLTCVAVAECNYNDVCDHNCSGDTGCTCLRGYNLDDDNSTCNDIDECNSTALCEHNCTNYPGGFHCSCDAGYELHENMINCSKCDKGYWGTGCQQNCSCNQINTEVCDHVTGTCTCRQGWTGDTCENDINECESKTCPDNSVCRNVDGSYVCDCHIGYSKLADSTVEQMQQLCEVCTNWFYGVDCEKPCRCDVKQSYSCGNVNGTCFCREGWTGPNCTTNVDECSSQISPCSNSECIDLMGSYKCICNPGYRSKLGSLHECEDIDECAEFTDGCTQRCHNVDGNFSCECSYGLWNNGQDCVEPSRTFPVALRFNITIPVPALDSKEYENYRGDIYQTLYTYFGDKLGSNFQGIDVTTVSNAQDGSVFIDFEVMTTYEDTVPVDLAAVMLELVSKRDGILFRQQVSYVDLLQYKLGEEIYNVTATHATACTMLTILDPCPTKQVCSVVEGLPTCVDEILPENTGLIIGLGIGIPLFLILILIPIIVCVFKRRKTEKDTPEPSSVSQQESISQGFFPSIIPIRLHSNLRPYYDSSQWDSTETGTTYGAGASTLDDDFSSEIEYYRHDEDDVIPNVRSNFSWDFMFRLLPEPYTITRPLHDPVPNPLYSERDGRGTPSS